jgi:hypothetical protein
MNIKAGDIVLADLDKENSILKFSMKQAMKEESKA